MNEERKMILEMLKEGKITVEEASDLLEAINNKKESFFDNSFTSKITSSVEKAIRKTAETIGNIDIDNIVNQAGKFSSSFSFQKEDSTKFDDEIEEIEVNIPNGSIEFNRSYDNYVKVDEIIHFKNKENASDDVLKIEVIDKKLKLFVNDEFKNNTKAEIEVLLPKKAYRLLEADNKNASFTLNDVDFERVDIKNTNGKIKVLNSVGEFDLKNVNGSINVVNVNGDCQLETVNGSIAINNVTSANIDSKCVNGTIRVDELNSSNSFFKSQNGSISISDIKDASRIEAKTLNGSIKVDTESFDKDIRAEIKGRNVDFSDKFVNTNRSSGNCTISTSNENIKLDLKLKTVSGKVVVK
ncbi:MAG: hypothetical protein Q4B52_07580 [Tissierellia bacterium]|nr:hypothetical protein [Tissierellia bacterium]